MIGFSIQRARIILDYLKSDIGHLILILFFEVNLFTIFKYLRVHF